MSKTAYNPDWIPPPGATIEDLLSRKGSARNREAILQRLGPGMAQQLFDGRLGIESDIATLLAQEVGLSRSFWLERERLYREALSRRKSEQMMLNELPLNEMKSRELIRPLRSHAEIVDEVVKFFGMEDSDSVSDHIEQLPKGIKQKTSRTIVSRPGPLAVWIRAGEIDADRIKCAAWSRQGLLNQMPAFRKLTRTKDPARYLPELRQLCQSCGVAFTVVRAPSGCVARGAVRFVSADKAMLLLSYRHLTDDHFWFSFFHELAHLILHPQHRIIVDDWEDSQTKEDVEADQYAGQILIPPEHQAELRTLHDDRSIIEFAQRVGTSRGIVVGQMQNQKIVGHHQYNHLKLYYHWNSRDQIVRKEP